MMTPVKQPVGDGRGMGALRADAAFTLLEIMVAAVGASIILAAVYGVFHQAVKMRDNAMERSRDNRLRSRAMNVIRNDLRNALFSGGILAATIDGDASGNDGPDSTFPGYLRLTTTTGKDTTDEMYGDVEQVEYYITKDDSGTSGGKSGTLVRVVTRDLLNTNPQVIHEERILTGVQSFQVAFYDGAQWQTSWLNSGTNTLSGSSSSVTTTTSGTSNAQTLPAAIRVDIQQAPQSERQSAPPPLEILMPWNTAPFLSGTNYVIGNGSVSPLPTP